MNLIRITLNAAMYAADQDLIGQEIRKQIREGTLRSLFIGDQVAIFCNDDIKPLAHARISILKDGVLIGKHTIGSLFHRSTRGQAAITVLVRRVLESLSDLRREISIRENQTLTSVSKELSPGTKQVDALMSVIGIELDELAYCQALDGSKLALTNNSKIIRSYYAYNVGYLPESRSFCVMRYTVVKRHLLKPDELTSRVYMEFGGIIQRLSFHQTIDDPQQPIVGFCNAVIFPRVPKMIYDALTSFCEYIQAHAT